MDISPFEFATANRIRFGRGVFEEIALTAQSFGKRVFLVLGFENENTQQLIEWLSNHDIDVEKMLVEGEPTVESIQNALKQAESFNCECIIGMGGGSAVDTAKAVSILLNNPGRLLDYLEVIGDGKKLKNPAIPCIAVPTTAGTGAEVTRNAVIASHDNRVKVSLRSPFMLPRLAVIDPVLTLSLPPAVTASTGLDAFTQVLEPFVSNQANPITDAFCREGLQRAARSLLRVYTNGDDLDAREDMCLASLFGGLALANSKLGAVHGFAGVIGGMFHGPHGVICARLLPFVIAANVNALQERNPDGWALRRYEEVAQLITGDRSAKVKDGVAWIEALSEKLSVPALSDIGMRSEDIPDVVEKSAIASSMKGNPIHLTHDELHTILELAM